MPETFGQRLTAALAARRASQTALGDHVGRSQGTVSLWCSDERRPYWKIIEKIAAFLEVDPGELTYGKPSSPGPVKARAPKVKTRRKVAAKRKAA